MRRLRLPLAPAVLVAAAVPATAGAAQVTPPGRGPVELGAKALIAPAFAVSGS